MLENKDKNQLRVFTQKELEEFDGKEGRLFYIVFKGKVYDLSQANFGFKARTWAKA
jgi:predicted heme/steroid binding protein